MSISRLYQCIATRNVNNSQAREVIYRLMIDEGECMSVSDITHKLLEVYPRKISLNTIYRHLTFFAECGLVMVIQDNMKKAYYCLTDDTAKAFAVCPKCNYLTIIKNMDQIDAMLITLDKTEFITIHKKCESCK